MVEKPAAREWLDRAREDLRAAEVLLAESDDPPLGPALFHCQQAAEKALKAAIVERGEAPPFVHDLEVLIDRLRALDLDLDELRDDGRTLSPYAVEPRYPDVARAYTADDATAALESARRFLERVEEDT